MITITELSGKQGQTLGHSDWLTIDQNRIDQFADVTEDHQFIHIDPKRAKSEANLDGTIAHGFLTLSLLSHMNSQVLPKIKDRVMTFNYGMNKIRFLSPVNTGERIRSVVTLKSVRRKSADRYLIVYEAKVEIEGRDSLALFAEQLALYVINEQD